MKRFVRIFALFLVLVSAINAGTGKKRTSYRPRYTLDPEKITEPGKIWLKDQLLFINDRWRGVHIFSISNLTQPQRLAAIPISDNVDIAVYSNALYADSYGSLVVYDVSDPTNPVAAVTISNACQYYGYTMGFGDDYEDGGFGCASSGCSEMAADGAGNGASTGTSSGGSMARFTIVDNYLYTLNFNTLQVYNISDPTNPDSYGQFTMPWTVETIFPWKDPATGYDYLFMGASDGVYVYSITNKLWPKQVSQLVHARSYDPVVVKAPYAYVTLRDGNFQEGPRSRLEVIALNSLTNMQVIKTIGMDSPYGLSAQDNYLYVCDGSDGMDIFDISDPTNTVKIKRLQGFNAYDVITTQPSMIITGNDGVRLYSLETNPIAPDWEATLQ